MKNLTNKHLLAFFIPIIGMALGVAVTIVLKVDQTDYGNLIVNLFYLAACVALQSIFKFTREDLGLKIIKGKLRWHAFISLAIFGFYILFYIFAFHISGPKPFSSSTAWGLLTYLVVVIAEELYFRGMLYGFLKKRFSAKTALIATSILFGLFHARQGLRGILSKTFTGWLWGSVRYSSGMIFLLIFPVHYAFNATWLLFEGNWSDPPAWAIFAFPAIEFFLGLAIVILRGRFFPLSNENERKPLSI